MENSLRDFMAELERDKSDMLRSGRDSTNKAIAVMAVSDCPQFDNHRRDAEQSYAHAKTLEYCLTLAREYCARMEI